MSGKDNTDTEITKRLDIIIGLLLRQQKDKNTSNRQTIKELNDMGLKDFEIARILGRSRSYVASELTQLRKSKGKMPEGVENAQ